MPEIAQRRALGDLVHSHLKGAGFSPDYVVTTPKPGLWKRPPFFTSLRLGDEALQPHAAIRLELDLDDVVDVYERFLGGYVFGKSLRGRAPVKWLGEALDLSTYAARHIFTPIVAGHARLSLQLNAVQLAALVTYNHDTDIDESPDTFAVRVGGFDFGVEGGLVLTNLRSRLVPAATLRGLPARVQNLSYWARGQGRMPASPSTFDMCRRWMLQNQDALNAISGPDTYTAMDAALEILWWRNSGHWPGRLKELTYAETSDRYLHAACEEARGFETFDRPLRGLAEIFTPQFMTSREFTERFGNVHQPLAFPLSNRVKNKWRAAIEDLDPGPQ